MKLNIYQIIGYKGDPNGFDGPQDYNYDEIVALESDLTEDGIQQRLSALANYNTSPSYVVIGEFKLIATFDAAKAEFV